MMDNSAVSVVAKERPRISFWRQRVLIIAILFGFAAAVGFAMERTLYFESPIDPAAPVVQSSASDEWLYVVLARGHLILSKSFVESSSSDYINHLMDESVARGNRSEFYTFDDSHWGDSKLPTNDEIERACLSISSQPCRFLRDVQTNRYESIGPGRGPRDTMRTNAVVTRIPVSSVLLLISFALVTYATAIHARRHRRSRQNKCQSCGYDMRSCSDGRCSECGAQMAT